LDFKCLHIEIHQVVCALTLPTMQDLQDRIIVYKNQRPDLMQAYHYIDGAYSKIFNPSAFEIEFFAPTFQKLIDTYPVTNEWDNRTRERLVGVSKSCLSRAQHRPDQLQTLVTTLDMLDHRRGTDWKSLYPKICDYLKHHAIIS